MASTVFRVVSGSLHEYTNQTNPSQHEEILREVLQFLAEGVHAQTAALFRNRDDSLELLLGIAPTSAALGSRNIQSISRVLTRQEWTEIQYLEELPGLSSRAVLVAPIAPDLLLYLATETSLDPPSSKLLTLITTLIQSTLETWKSLRSNQMERTGNLLRWTVFEHRLDQIADPETSWLILAAPKEPLQPVTHPPAVPEDILMTRIGRGEYALLVEGQDEIPWELLESLFDSNSFLMGAVRLDATRDHQIPPLQLAAQALGSARQDESPNRKVWEENLLKQPASIGSLIGLLGRGYTSAVERLSIFLDAIETCSYTLEKDRIYEVLFETPMMATGAREGTLLLHDLYDKILVFRQIGIFEEHVTTIPEEVVERLEQEIRDHRIPYRLDLNALWENEPDPPAGGNQKGVAVPIRSRGKALGLLYLQNFPTDPPSGPDMAFLELAGRLIASRLDSAILYQEHEKQKKRIAKLNKVFDHQVKTQTIQIRRLSQELDQTREDLKNRYDYKHVIGDSPKMLEIKRIMDKVIDSNLPVLIQGESGTGKEVIAKTIHYNGARKDNNFVSENCAAIGSSLFESELFGYEKGAFTGAEETKLGLFEIACQGTILLDEIGEIDPENQKKLLRVLQEGEIRRVGGTKPIPIDVQIISATNADLEQMVHEKKFREDLYYRLKVISIRLPSLRERPEDIPLLIAHFLKKIAEDPKKTEIKFSDKTLKAFMKYSWPGNVRELENEIHRLAIMGEEGFTPGQTTSMRRPPVSGISLPDGLTLQTAIEQIERELIVRAMKEHAGNKSSAAKALGIGRMKLHRTMERLDIQFPQ